jgi:hypothetical protein
MIIYQKTRQIIANSQTAKKKSNHHLLTVGQKAPNHELARQRNFVEYVILKVKVFHIVSER